MNHLIEGCIEAIKNGPPLNTSGNKWQNLFAEEYKNKMKVVLRHYQQGGSMSNRP